MKLRKILVVAGLFFALSVAAQEHIEKKYSLFFRVSRSDIDSTYMGNGHTIRTMIDDIKTTLEVQGAVPDSLLIYASSSPEGPSALNQRSQFVVQKMPGRCSFISFRNSILRI